MLFVCVSLPIYMYNIAGEEQVLSGKYSVTLGEWYILQMEAKVSIIHKCQLRLVIYISWLSSPSVCVCIYIVCTLYKTRIILVS